MTIEKVKQNKGVPGIDKMTVQEVEEAKVGLPDYMQH